MNFIRLIIALICFNGFVYSNADLNEELNKEPSNQLPDNFESLPEDVQSVLLEYAFYSEQAHDVWGEDFISASQKDYVKYLDGYNIRSTIDFDLGKIRIEGIKHDNNIAQQMKAAIATTLLSPADPNQVDIYTAKEIGLSGTPFLYKQVVDHEGKDIQYPWRANRFADYLVQNKLQSKWTSNGAVYWVEIPMVKNHVCVASKQYQEAIHKASVRYDLLPELIAAIIATESSFNPFAVSHAGAYGLMQIMPKTAGADVFQKIKKRSGRPSRNYLFNGANNIDIGSAYLTILRDNYLSRIENEETMLYCMIAAYNSGAGHLLQSFHRKQSRAFEMINRMTPEQVYNYIVRNHLKRESRNYLKKVNAYMDKFSS